MPSSRASLFSALPTYGIMFVCALALESHYRMSLARSYIITKSILLDVFAPLPYFSLFTHLLHVCPSLTSFLFSRTCYMHPYFSLSAHLSHACLSLDSYRSCPPLNSHRSPTQMPKGAGGYKPGIEHSPVHICTLSMLIPTHISNRIHLHTHMSIHTYIQSFL
jgi:hypothetical protein